jgi:hypothetical protein
MVTELLDRMSLLLFIAPALVSTSCLIGPLLGKVREWVNDGAHPALSPIASTATPSPDWENGDDLV